jgi:hypothetical protein
MTFRRDTRLYGGNCLDHRLDSGEARWEVCGEDEKAEKAWAGELLHDFKHDA